MAIHFITDSASDILPAEAAEMGITVLPLTVSFGTEQYQDSINLSHREFYEKLIEGDILPTTAQITPAAYEDALKQVLREGDTAIIFALAGKLSGTCQSARIAAAEYGDRVTVIDTENVCVGQRILVQRALALREQGCTAAEITDIIEKEKKYVRVLAVLDTLEYLKKGGRISAATAFAGTLLSIKPVVAVVDGEVAMVGKARGSRNGNNLLRELIRKNGGVDFDKPYALAYSGLTDTLLQKYIEDSADLWRSHTEALPLSTVGCTIGTHVGPGAIALAFFAPMN